MPAPFLGRRNRKENTLDVEAFVRFRAYGSFRIVDRQLGPWLF